MFDHTDGVMHLFAKKKTHWKEDMFFTQKIDRLKLSIYYPDMSPTAGIHLISAQLVDPIHNLISFGMLDRGMDINSEDGTSNTTHHQEAILMYVMNQYCGKHRWVSVSVLQSVPISNLIPATMASGSGESSCDSYDLSRHDEEYLTPTIVAE
jgi:hypothetical protein